MKLYNAIIATALAILPLSAIAQPTSGVYVGGSVGANFLQDEHITRGTFPQTSNPPSKLSNSRANFDTGYVALGSVGYGFNNGIRVELEGSYRQNSLNAFGSGRGSTFNTNFLSNGSKASGDEKKYGAMANVLYDINTGWGFTPYVGVGAGYMWVTNSNYQIKTPDTLYRGNDAKGSLAYQGIIGVAVPLQAVPGLSLTAEYRFLGLADNRSYNFQYMQAGLATRARLHEADNYNHSLLIGARYAFNTPSKAVVTDVPVPVSVVAESRSYIVFFDWDRADLTVRAKQIIASAATTSSRVKVTQINVSGHADSSGSHAYNEKLSMLRAKAVANELVSNGVASNTISIKAYGDTKPLVPVAVGTREPQNRRVEIVLH